MADETGVPKKGSAMKQTVLFIVFIVVVVAVLTAISGERQNRIPDDDNHRGINDPAVCLSQCHAPDKIKPRGPKHPPKDQCLICHKRKRGQQ